MKNSKKHPLIKLFFFISILLIFVGFPAKTVYNFAIQEGIFASDGISKFSQSEESKNSEAENLDIERVLEQEVAEGVPYIEINENKPTFQMPISPNPFEYYGELDSLGRTTEALACLGMETFPTENRGKIGKVKPSGWHTLKFDFVDGKYLYNRCHLIGYQLSGENANEKNLITGTRYLNINGMLPFENMIADYIKETNNHVMYQVIPIYKGNDLVARGLSMQAQSLEDNGEGISFNIFCYNTQPNIMIDYETGAASAK